MNLKFVSLSCSYTLFLCDEITCLVTTDVQAVFLGILDVNVYTIRCTYLNNTDVRGCKYILVSIEERLDNITGVIKRGILNEAVVTIQSIGCYREILAYGDDDSVEPLPISLRIDLQLCRYIREYK